MVKISFSKRRHRQLFFKHTYPVWIAVLFTLIALSVSGCDWFDSQKPQKQNFPLKKINIATFKGLFSAPVYIAFVNGYFEEEGLNITLNQYMSGKACLKALLAGKADLATVAETPLMHAGLRREKIYIVASFVNSERNLAIVAKDRSIMPDKLKGKKIGVTVGTNGEFFLDTFLAFHGMQANEVKLINLKPDEMFNALINGKVDAVSTWNPHVLRLKKEIGDKGIIYYGEEMYVGSFNIAAMQDFVNNNPEAIKNVLRALAKAVQFMRENPKESRDIIGKQTNSDLAVLSELWDEYNFGVTLTQTLLMTLEDEARWAIKNKLTDKTEVPNYLDYIYLDAMEAVKPKAVTIIK